MAEVMVELNKGRIEDVPTFEPEPNPSLPPQLFRQLSEGEQYVITELRAIRADLSVLRKEIRWTTEIAVQAYNRSIDNQEAIEREVSRVNEYETKFKSPLMLLGWLCGSLIVATLGALASRLLGGK